MFGMDSLLVCENQDVSFGDDATTNDLVLAYMQKESALDKCAFRVSQFKEFISSL